MSSGEKSWEYPETYDSKTYKTGTKRDDVDHVLRVTINDTVMYIAIAGNIGSGKTTLTQMLTERYAAKCYLEECDNPYIGDFYENMNRWAFNLQISFLGSRIQQTMDMLSDSESGVIFQDRTIYEDAHIFADNLHEMGLMTTRDIETYMKIFRLVTSLIPQPDLLIYLKASVPTLISQIRKRGREYEMNIDERYLKRLNDKYNHWIDKIYEGEVLVIDKTRNVSYSVQNRDMLDRGGQCRRVVYTPGQSTWAAMRYTGEYQIRQSREEELTIELGLAGCFPAFPGDTVRLELEAMGLSGEYRVAEAENTAFPETGEVCTLILRERI